MEKHPLTRDDDDYLVLKLWQEFYQVDKRLPVSHLRELYSIMKDMPKADDIIRCRRHIQSRDGDNELHPTKESVMLARRQRRETFAHEELGYPAGQYA